MDHDNGEGPGGVKRVLISFTPAVLATLDRLRDESGDLSRSAMIAFLVDQEDRRRQLEEWRARRGNDAAPGA